MSDSVRAFEEGLAKIAAAFEPAFAACIDEGSLRAANARFAGPSGELTALLKLMPSLPGDRRKELGQRANQVKGAIGAALDARLGALARAAREADLNGPPIDVSLPGRSTKPGRPHPITSTIEELLDGFASLGFEIAESREIELTDFNFARLGFPPDHPATDMQDSFFVKRPDGTTDESLVLRTHTTSIQVHEMLRRKPPMAVVCAGTVYRRDDDATHSPMFHQIDGFLVDRGVTFAHLKGVLTAFVHRTFGADVPVRFRPSYFPFVEPGGELDIGCTFCRPWDGAGSKAQIDRTNACRTCKSTGYIEVLGCGMIHPTVFASCGVTDPSFTGFAWGMGIDRIAMLRHGIRDIRMLYENDMRFLTQL
jgi:phenylalanyl-tRNA synthetase alpha chain